MISMDDVAQKAGVSKMTVSRVLNGNQPVSEVTRERVLSVCEELNYKINHSIQDLVLKSRNGATRNIAFVLVGREFADPAYSYLIDPISVSANSRHYQLLLVKLSGTERSIYDLPPVLRDERVDGILLTGVLTENIISTTKKIGAQCVVIGDYRDKLLNGLPRVRMDMDTMVFEAVKKLYEKGCRRIALAEENPKNFAAQRLRQCFLQTLSEFGLNCDGKFCYGGNGPMTGLFEVLKPVFRQPKLPFDSMFCYDFRLAQEISHLALAHFGLDRPVDFTLAVFRHFDYYTLPTPVIFIDDPSRKIVDEAMEKLIAGFGEDKKQSELFREFA